MYGIDKRLAIYFIAAKVSNYRFVFGQGIRNGITALFLFFSGYLFKISSAFFKFSSENLNFFGWTSCTFLNSSINFSKNNIKRA